MKLRHVDTSRIGEEDALRPVWRAWDGSVACAPGEMAATPDLHLAPGAPVDAAAFFREHGLVGRIQPLGCHFLRNVTVCGMLYLFQDNALLDDGSHLSMVAADWLRRFPAHGPRAWTENPTRVVDAPVLAVAGPGHQTYGHWIIDFLPRLEIARQCLGRKFGRLKFLVLSDTPDWAMSLMREFFNIRETDCMRLEAGVDEFFCRRLCYPTFAHSYPFLLHSLIPHFYKAYIRGGRRLPVRKLCVQRPSPTRDHRPFDQRVVFEAQAALAGFELVDPQGLSVRAQADLFASASTVIGEYGSALHNSVFCPAGTVFGVLNAPGVEQTRLCAAFRQPIVYMPSDTGSGRWSLSEDQLQSFFTAVHAMEREQPGLPPHLDAPDAGWLATRWRTFRRLLP